VYCNCLTINENQDLNSLFLNNFFLAHSQSGSLEEEDLARFGQHPDKNVKKCKGSFFILG
jgi:hypothetical protein